MTQTLLTPLELSSAAVKVAPRRYRKQILPLGTITYKGRKVNFDRPMMSKIIEAYNEQAVEQVPYQIADGANAHNNFPELTRGDIVGLEMASDGLDAIIDVTEDGEKLLLANPKLGTSARIELNSQRANDGKIFPYVLQHVLGTVNPRVVGLRPWEKVDLSSVDESEIIDLSTERFDVSEENMGATTKPPVDDKNKVTAPPAGAPTTPPKEGETVTVELSKDDHAELLELLADQKRAKELALSSPDGEGDDDGDDPDGAETPDPQALGLTAEGAAALELANATAATAHAGYLELSNRLRVADVTNELREFEVQGLAPAILDLARPVLEAAPMSLELSNGTKLDPADSVRKLLTEITALAKTNDVIVDLSNEYGAVMGEDDPQHAAHQAKVDAWERGDYGPGN